MDEPLVSIVVPIYNMEHCIEDFVERFLRQTYKKFELILVNDGSTDHSLSVIKRMQERDDRIQIIDKKNGGVSTARNAGIDAACGEYISFVDPDDEILEDYVSVLVRVALENRADVVAGCITIKYKGKRRDNHFFQCKEEGDIIEVDKKRLIAQMLSNTYYKDADGIMDIGITVSKLYNRNFIVENNLHYNEKLRRHQDNLFNLEVAQYAESFFYVDHSSYIYDFEHFKSIQEKYNDCADEIYGNLIRATFQYMKKWNLFNDEIFLLVYSKRIYNYFLSVCFQKLCHPYNPVGKREQKKKFIAFCKEKERKHILKSLYIKDADYSTKMRLCLLKREWYSILFEITYERQKQVHNKSTVGNLDSKKEIK